MKLQQILVQETNFPQAVSENLIIQELKDELLIYNLATHKAFCLNETSALVWQACDGTKSISEISLEVGKKLKSSINEDFILLALDGLKKDNLLIESEDLEISFGGLSRREMIRKVGLATLVTLPLVSSLVAPPAAAAASSGSGSGACSSGCSTIGSVCSCASVSCPPGTTIGVGVNVGVCATVAVAASLGINVSAGVNGNVCLVTAACVRIGI